MTGFSVLLNDKNGGLMAPIAYDISASGLTKPLLVGLLDLNGDQKPDIIITDAVAPQALLLFNQGAGTFNVATQGTGYFNLSIEGPATQIVPFDIDGDGRLDLIVPQETKDEVLISISTDHLAFSPIKLTTKSPRKITFGDLNGDGLPDLIVLNASGYAVDVFLQQHRTLPSDPFFATAPAVSVPLVQVGTLVQLAVTDFPPADGKLDLVVAGSAGFAILPNTSH